MPLSDPSGSVLGVVTAQPAIEAEGLVKRYGETRALDGACFSAREGTVLGVLGPNGAGKTTAVRVLATLLTPDAGRAVVGGHDVVTEPHRVRSLIGLTGQYAGVDEALTGAENLVLIARLLGLPRAAARARAAELLEQFGLAHAGGRAARTYSGGMRRRLDLASSLVGRPRFLFLDEPTTGLDPASRNELWGMVRSLTDDGVTVLLTTQYLEEADQLADDIVVIDRGVVVATGTPDELKAKAGAAVLQMRPARASDLEVVRQVSAELAAATPVVEHGLVSVPAGDEALMPAVVRRLDDVGVRLAELTLRRATLDEVFLALTGHRASTDDTTTEPTETVREAV